MSKAEMLLGDRISRIFISVMKYVKYGTKRKVVNYKNKIILKFAAIMVQRFQIKKQQRIADYIILT